MSDSPPQAPSRKQARARPSKRRFSLLAAVREGVGSLLSRPLRSGLAALATAAAVATITLVVVALDGVERFARTNAARAFGSDTFVIAKVASPGRISRKELEAKLERNPNIERDDLRFLERNAERRVLYGATANARVELVAGSRSYEGASLIGASAEIAALRDLAIDEGRFFTREESLQARQVAVIGAVLVDELFPNADPLGQRVRIAGRGFTVIGLQERQGNVGGSSLDRNVWIPLPTFERVFGPPETLQILARAPTPGTETTSAAEDRARVSLRARHQLQPGEEDDFDMLSPDAARGFVQSLSERVGAAALPISAMALLAAVLVVANTILVSVTQRTNEIGVRRAVGATSAQILGEVLAESVAVSLLGGLAGVLGVYLLILLAGNAGIDLRLELGTVLWSLAAASLSGLLAGFAPARRATRIDVVEALRAQ